MTQFLKNPSRAAAAVAAFFSVGAVTAASLAQGTGSTGGAAVPVRDIPRQVSSARRPAGAIVLFDGKDLSAWQKRDGGGPASWRIEDGAAVVGGGDIMTRQKFRDCRLHVEFNVPSMPDQTGQGRGNSGVYLMGSYEVQVLDSYGPAINPPGRPLRQDECGAIYSQAAPRVNATLPPGTWQTYDIWFRAPRFDAKGKVAERPRITVIHNGVKIHDNFEIKADTRAGMGAPSTGEGPILLQDHGNPVRYRNIWVVPR